MREKEVIKMKKMSGSIKILAVISAITAILLIAAILVSCGDDEKKKDETTAAAAATSATTATAGAVDSSDAVTTVFPSTVGTNEQGELTFPDFGTGIELPDIPIG